MASSSRPVYSTELGRLCPGCGLAVGNCGCGRPAAAPARVDGPARVRLETKGRKGKGVTLVSGLPLGEEALIALGRQLRQCCGSGGTVKLGVIEIQGDHRQTVTAELVRQGFVVRQG